MKVSRKCSHFLSNTQWYVAHFFNRIGQSDGDQPPISSADEPGYLMEMKVTANGPQLTGSQLDYWEHLWGHF